MKQHSTCLIKGPFRPEKARTILMDLINHKINFHKIEKLSGEIRFGSDVEHSQERVNQLMKERSELSDWLQALHPEDMLDIHCEIVLKKRPKSKPRKKSVQKTEKRMEP